MKLRHELPPILRRCAVVRGNIESHKGHLGYRVRFHGHVDDDTKGVPAASADGPVDVLVLAFIRCDQVTVGRDYSGLEDIIRSLAVFSSHVTMSASSGPSDNADVLHRCVSDSEQRPVGLG